MKRKSTTPRSAAQQRQNRRMKSAHQLLHELLCSPVDVLRIYHQWKRFRARNGSKGSESDRPQISSHREVIWRGGRTERLIRPSGRIPLAEWRTTRSYYQYAVRLALNLVIADERQTQIALRSNAPKTTRVASRFGEEEDRSNKLAAQVSVRGGTSDEEDDLRDTLNNQDDEDPYALLYDPTNEDNFPSTK